MTPPPEVGPGPALAVPAVPRFELPPGEPGVRTVRELRVRGQHDWLGTEITVKGYITWIYDCAKQIARPGETPAQVQRRIDDDQTICERPKLYLGATKDAPPERSIWVVSVPRPPTKMERRILPKRELASWPAVPKFALGDHVAVTGTWTLQSPHGDRNSDGLLVFKALRPAPVPPAAPARPATAAPPAPPAPAAAPPKLPPAPPPARIDPAKRRQSIEQSNEGVKALGRADFGAAIRAYTASVTTWPENHAAWYYLAYAQFRNGDPAAAAAAVANSIRLAPGVAMYHLMHGVYLYEAAVARARAAQAGPLDLRTVNQDAALAALDLAAHLDARLWRAHYYRGRILRDRGDAGPAAEALTRAVRNAPPMSGPYVALAELYRRWDHFDPAIAVARLGAGHLAGDDRADVLYVLGLAHEGKREDVAAREAYTKALDARPGLAVALFQRGQLLARLKQPAAAKRDLEAFVAHPDAPPWERSIAQRLLHDLEQRKP